MHLLPTPRQSVPPIALGLASVVLATISVLLFFLPVLALPIATCGLVLAIVAAVSTIWRQDESLRWALTGLCGSLAAIGMGLAINFAPVGEEPRPDVPPLWQLPPAAPFVAPPAPPGFMERPRSASFRDHGKD